jgi:hypothetical protein
VEHLPIAVRSHAVAANGVQRKRDGAGRPGPPPVGPGYADAEINTWWSAPGGALSVVAVARRLVDGGVPQGTPPVSCLSRAALQRAGAPVMRAGHA